MPATKETLTAAVVNFNTARLSGECVRSLVDAGLARVLVLDNGSARADYEALAAAWAGEPRVRVIRSEENLGFALGCNRLVEEALGEPGCANVLLLNSDAVAVREGFDACLAKMDAGGYALMGGRMEKPGPAGEVDSLGITLYKCLLASNRKSTGEVYLGPTGGFAIYSRAVLEDVVASHGHVFDPSYFCYAEDTDLAVRARLLGHSAGYTDDVVALHAGQGSHGGQYNDFILYHGIRNSIWMMVKSIPWRVVAARLHWVVLLHGGIVLRHVMGGRARTLFRLYRDAICGLPAVLAARRKVRATRRITPAEFATYIDQRFYEETYLANARRELVRR